jgi:lipopolysaccharide transport system permease protein
MVNFMVQFVLFAIFVIYYAYLPTSSVSPDWKLILLTPLLLIQLGLLGMGCGIIVSALTARYRDLAMLVSFGVNLWMYASPVTYSASMIADRFPALAPYYMLNPVTPVINLFRSAFLGAELYPIEYNAASLLITCAVTLLGVILFSHTEKTFMDTV